ncbi:MAG TPA: ZIP family metal transporter [Candidatus Krumholzibacteria bacterium]|nr:ZIP family metal transporter [Candidatus Krumholzibacteria bacterium]
MTPALWTALFALIAAVATLAGGFAATFPGRLSRAQLSHLIAFGAGYILAAALVSLLPESLRLVDNAPLFVLAGYALAHLFEHTFTSHFHFGEETHHEHVVDPAVSLNALVGLGLHSFFDGVAIASGFLVTPSLGLLIALAVILHKVPEGVTISSLMVASGHSRTAAVRASGLLAVSTLAGAGAMALLGEGVKGTGLAISCGIALYVAATDLMPEFNQEGERIYSLSALAGVVLYFAIYALSGRLGIH